MAEKTLAGASKIRLVTYERDEEQHLLVYDIIELDLPEDPVKRKRLLNKRINEAMAEPLVAEVRILAWE